MKKAFPIFALGLTALSLWRPTRAEATPEPPAPGSLIRLDTAGEPQVCPLEHTDVTASIEGPVARVRVRQIFRNPGTTPIEALYTFPLAASGAVDQMTIKIGDRVVRGSIQRKEEARRIYEQAKAKGQLAGLLDQERPNVFTQSLANIPPGAKVEVEISYVEMVRYAAGAYEFVFPMVVGPRYSPKHNPGAFQNPPVAAKGTRAGHDISLSVDVDAGLAIRRLESTTHEVEIREGRHVALRNRQEIPNKDFILRYQVAGEAIADAVLAQRGQGDGHFTLLLAPPARPEAAEITPKELVFVIDTSGSMHGFPLDKAKESMLAAIEGLHPRDTFNLITFAGDTHLLFDRPVPATAANVRQAKEFLRLRQGGGGTEMMKAIRAALDPSDSQEHLRIVCFMTDGYVGNESEILAEIERHANARVFSFGIGSSVNRHLLDQMADRGRGEVEYVGLQDDGSAAARRFHERVRTPLLTDIRLDWGKLPVREVYPQRIPDLFDAKPLIVTGRYGAGAEGEVRITGKLGGRPFERRVKVHLPASEQRHAAIPTLWARNKVAALSRDEGANKEAITQLGLDYRMLTSFTSFVAVEERTVTEGGQSRTIVVPVEMPEGVNHETAMAPAAPMMARSAKSSGFGGGVIGGIVGGMPQTAAPTGPLPRPVESRRAEPERAEKLADAAVNAKLDASLAAQWRQAGPKEKIGVRVFVTAATPEVLETLKKAGFVLASRLGDGRLLTGEIEAGKLAALLRLAVVQHVAPR